MEKLRLLELFGGIGACSKALERLGIDYEIVDYVEIDKYAVNSFNAIHGTKFVPQDIKEWDKDVIVDLIMHGSPCQDFSLAGKQAGGDKDSGTRSSLMYETIRIVKKLKPKYVVWENVKNLLSKKHRHNFDAYLEIMENLGYNNYYQVLNAKDYRIPQNRERVFTISIRKDIDIDFKFPEKQELKLKLKDMLEDEVDEKYYLSDKMIKYISATGTANFKNPDCKINLDIARPITTDPNKRAGTTNYLSNEFPDNYDLNGSSYLRNFGSKGKLQDKEYCDTLTASMGTGGGNIPYFTFPPKQPLTLKLKDILEDEVDEKYYLTSSMINYLENGKYQSSKVSNKLKQTETGICPTLDTIQGGNRQPFIKSRCKRLESLVKKTEFEEGKVLNMDLYNQTTNENISQCLTEPQHNSQRLFDGLRIRKLTPKECWRLMGFDDEDFEKASKVNSNTQLYKQAGNSIVVNVLEAIFKNLFRGEKYEKSND